MVASALEGRLRRLIGSPLEFWPFQRGLARDEMAMRASRLTIYLGAVWAHRQGRAEAMVMPVTVALAIALLFGGSRSLKLDAASLATDPNPAGNAELGDMAGRSLDVPQPPPNISAEAFTRRMQEPVRVDDYQIRPVLGPTQAHQVWKDPTGIPSSTAVTVGARDGHTFVGR